MFRFATPEYFYLLLILPLLWGVHLLSARARRRAIERFGDPATVSELMPEASTARPRYKFVLFSAAVLLLVVALARPQFGSKLKEVTRTGIEMMLAVDVSNSMLAQDFEPSRLERTKFAIDRLTQQLEQDRIGLIVFAGDAYMQLPITSDYVAARSFAAQISPTMVSKQGTAIGAAIDLAASSFSSGSEGSRVIVVISDGENHEDDALAAAKAAAEKGIRIYTIGIGTPEGAPISIDGEFIKDEQGDMVVSKLDEQMLEQIALTTGGAYIRATNRSLGLDEIVQKINEVEKKELTSTVFEDFNEQYQYLIGLSSRCSSVGAACWPVSIFSENAEICGRTPYFWGSLSVPIPLSYVGPFYGSTCRDELRIPATDNNREPVGTNIGKAESLSRNMIRAVSPFRLDGRACLVPCMEISCGWDRSLDREREVASPLVRTDRSGWDSEE